VLSLEDPRSLFDPVLCTFSIAGLLTGYLLLARNLINESN
jgi:hypothetical protein